MFSRVSSLQLFLGTKEASSKETSEDVRLGALELATALYYSQGRALAIGVAETASIAGRYCNKGNSVTTRRAGLRLMAAAVEGVGSGHRNADGVQLEALRVVERLFKEKDLAEPIRCVIYEYDGCVAFPKKKHPTYKMVCCILTDARPECQRWM